MADGGNGVSAKPIYNLFVEQAKNMNPRYLVMIIPARWYSGGKGLDRFRDDMLADKRIKELHDFVNSKDCFDGLSVSGGICYFLWDKDYKGKCMFNSVNAGVSSSSMRTLNEFPIFVRYNEAVSVIYKVKSNQENTIVSIVSSRNPFGISTNMRGQDSCFKGAYKLVSSDGDGYIKGAEIRSGHLLSNSYKVMITRVMREHAGEPAKDGKFGV
jgi:site-specific DNA-methyltransferase (adenine-specific)